MNPFNRRLRSLVIALAVLALSAGVALAGRTAPSRPRTTKPPPTRGRTRARRGRAGTGGPSEPEGRGARRRQADVPTRTRRGRRGRQAERPTDRGRAIPTTTASSSARPPSGTPAGFDNHGAYVRTIAKANHGHDTARRPSTPRPRTRTETRAEPSRPAARPDTMKPAPEAPASRCDRGSEAGSVGRSPRPDEGDRVLELELGDRQVLREVGPVDLRDRPHDVRRAQDRRRGPRRRRTAGAGR